MCPSPRLFAEKLDDRPFLTVVMLRCCFVMAPPATYALALSVRVPLRNAQIIQMIEC